MSLIDDFLEAVVKKYGDDAGEAAAKLFAKAADASDFRRLVNELPSVLPKEKFVTSKLSRPSAVGQEMSDFVQKVAENPRELTLSEFPQAARNLGLIPVEGITYGKPGKVRELSARGRAQLEENIEAMLDAVIDGRKGDPNFYRDMNKLLGLSAPDVDRILSSYTFAPFSGSSAVRENARRWQRFMENPEMFPGRIFPEGGTTTGGAWQDAIRILGKENPTTSDLSTTGKIVKIGSFGENIAFPETSMRATIDRHAIKNLLGLYMPDNLTPDLGDEATYRLFEKAFQNVAERRGMLPSEVQSAAWDTWRRIANANPGEGMIVPSDFVPLNVSQMFNVDPATRRAALKEFMTAQGKDAQFMKRARLL